MFQNPVNVVKKIELKECKQVPKEVCDKVPKQICEDKPKEVTKTVCVGCSVGCEIEVLTRDNNLVRINGNWDAKMNEGELGQ